MDLTIEDEIRRLQTRPIAALKQRYRELFGEPSASANRAHLIRRIGWRLQSLAEGDLSERARRRAAELASDADLRVRPPRSFSTRRNNRASEPTAARDPRVPAAGTVLRRSFGARLIEVTVREDGYEFEGQHFGSLSAIASRVTGTRWNGFSFFRLNGQAERG